jgi:hypothetical protein
VNRRPTLSFLALVTMSCGGASGVPDGGNPGQLDAGGDAVNPDVLWLASNLGSEINLKLAETEPPPF